MRKLLIALFLLPIFSSAQTDLENALKLSQVLVSGFSIVKGNSTAKNDSKTISSVCIKNKLQDKIEFKLVGKDEEGNEVKKEMVVQNDGKECVFSIPKGVYAYEVILSNREIYKKGEYKFDDDAVITIKKED